MWNPFKKSTRSSISEAVGLVKPVSIQIQIITAMEGMIDALDAEIPPVPQKQILPVSNEVKALIDAGFVNHKEVKAFNDKQANLDAIFDAKYKVYASQVEKREALQTALKVLIRARKKYGPNTLLMPIDQFIQICKNHNLVCGTFDQYTGEIPLEKLQEITRLKRVNSTPDLLFKVNKIIKTGSGGFSSKKEYQTFDQHFDKNFPFFNDVCGSFIYRVEFLDSTQATFHYMEFEYTQDYYFIAAPKKMMSGEVQEVYEPNKDPIIWGLHGKYVLIFTRWGEEANDEVIRRYEAFNRKLDAFAASLE